MLYSKITKVTINKIDYHIHNKILEKIPLFVDFIENNNEKLELDIEINNDFIEEMFDLLYQNILNSEPYLKYGIYSHYEIFETLDYFCINSHDLPFYGCYYFEDVLKLVNEFGEKTINFLNHISINLGIYRIIEYKTTIITLINAKVSNSIKQIIFKKLTSCISARRMLKQVATIEDIRNIYEIHNIAPKIISIMDNEVIVDDTKFELNNKLDRNITDHISNILFNL